jgi:hypothetical protein
MPLLPHRPHLQDQQFVEMMEVLLVEELVHRLVLGFHLVG